MFSCTHHLGGKMTKSARATPGVELGAVRTVNMEGSWGICNKSCGFLC